MYDMESFFQWAGVELKEAGRESLKRYETPHSTLLHFIFEFPGLWYNLFELSKYDYDALVCACKYKYQPKTYIWFYYLLSYRSISSLSGRSRDQIDESTASALPSAAHGTAGRAANLESG